LYDSSMILRFEKQLPVIIRGDEKNEKRI